METNIHCNREYEQNKNRTGKREDKMRKQILKMTMKLKQRVKRILVVHPQARKQKQRTRTSERVLLSVYTKLAIIIFYLEISNFHIQYFCRCITCNNVVDKTKPTHSCLLCSQKVHFDNQCSGTGKVGSKQGYHSYTTHTQLLYCIHHLFFCCDRYICNGCLAKQK